MSKLEPKDSRGLLIRDIVVPQLRPGTRPSLLWVSVTFTWVTWLVSVAGSGEGRAGEAPP